MGRGKTAGYKTEQQQITFAKKSAGDRQQKVPKTRENTNNRLCKQNGQSWLVRSQDCSLDSV